jgi:hypothetical protein
MAPIKNLWIEPKELPVTVKEFSFGYENDKGRKKVYKVSVKGNDLYSFHAFVHALYVCKKNNLLPWAMPAIRKVKDKVNVVNPKAKKTPAECGIQQEMVLKVAGNFQERFPWEN